MGRFYKYKNIHQLPAEARRLAPALTGIVLPSCWNQAIYLPRCVNVLALQGHSVDLPSLQGDRKSGQARVGPRTALGVGI